ncbi:MAG: PQQ-binding-like beta-propeller repeat protein [Candidatus Bathyarchaeota archaeon]|nr:PQQ-binding-like beta-propeller repeat protein [Candidatus Bathyarchaeota archaeon]
MPLLSLPLATAHDPPWTIPTYAYISVAPDPVGVDQTCLIIFWLNQLPPSAAGLGGDRWRNLTIDIEKPDGSTTVLGPFNSDPVGSCYTQFTPDQTGMYTLTFNFPGQVASLYGPGGIAGSNSPYINDTYTESSATTTLTVQADPVPGLPEYPLPNEYWSRPIEGQNIAWASLVSNWLGSPQIVAKLQPDGIAPSSAHVMWTRPISFGGIAGGQYTTNNAMPYYSGTAYEGKFGSPLILYGRLYYDLPQSNSRSGDGYVCVDLQTGEEIYWQNMTAPTFGQLYDYESMNQHGIIPNGYLWKSVNDPANGGSVWMAYDPMNGNWLFNETNVPRGTQAYGPNGEILIYQLDYEGRWLAMWNNTAAHGLTNSRDPTDWTSSNYYQWRPLGKNVNASDAYSWNVTVPDLPGVAPPAIISIIQDDVMIGTSSTMGGLLASGTPDPYTIWAVSLKPESRGELMWIKDFPAPANNLTRSIAQVDPVTRVIAILEKETLCYYGLSVDDGSELWGPTPREADFNYYADVGLPRNNIAYGRLYSVGYGGFCYCYDLTDGRLLWTYEAPAGFATPYGRYPLGIGAIADGKVYLYSTEHSANSPLTPGAKIRCVDAYSGDEVWSVFSYGTQNGMAVADGYLVFLDLYDMQIYCVGKGPSALTVTAPTTATPQGINVLIQGTITDEASGTKQTEQAARFPNGVPAVSDSSMNEWIEYVYMQKPLPTDVTGVEVHLTAIDPNGNIQDIGVATSDELGNYATEWTPPIPGLYTVTATFEGSDAYYGSKAGTAFVVSETAASPSISPQPSTDVSQPPTATPTQLTSPSPSEAPQPPTSGMPTETYIAIVAAVVVLIVAATIILRRKN